MGTGVAKPLSIRLFALIFSASLLLSLILALYSARTMTFGFPITPEAATTLNSRILAIRLVGAGFALSLMLLVVFGRSRTARGALLLRWVLGVTSSMVFLRCMGLVHPAAQADALTTAASLAQLGLEAFSILLLFSEDAREWFGPRGWN